MKILFVTNQGGNPVVDLTCAVAREWVACQPDGQAYFAVWWVAEGQRVREQAPFAAGVHVYEEFLRDAGDWRDQIDRLNRDYPEVNWSTVIASERSFCDSSFLLGAGGNRRESHDYVQRILVNMVRFLESVLAGGMDAIVCQTADSLFTHVLYKVAPRHGVRLLAIKPAWLGEGGRPGFALAADEYTHIPRMIEHYRSLCARTLTKTEVERAEMLRKTVLGFDVGHVVSEFGRRRYVVGPLSPNIRRLPSYLLKNLRTDREIDYGRFDLMPKVKANLLRLWRRWRTAPLLGRRDSLLPQRYVLLALHFQPEQSSLVGGIYYANQVALAENVAKSLPLGWTLVIKEHPKGRGSRPAWQYRHLTSFPNVTFSDAPTKELLARAGAVVTITGTIALEAMAMDRPVVLLGKTYFDYAEVLYRPAALEELAVTLRRILIDREYETWHGREDLIRKFLLSYALGLTPGLPMDPETARPLAEAIVEALSSRDTSASAFPRLAWLSAGSRAEPM